MGPVANWRPIVNRPGARPRKFLGSTRQPSFHRIVLDVPPNPPKLHFVTNQVIVTFMLPKRPTDAQHSIALQASKSLKRLHHLGHVHQRSNQQMNMIRHDNVRVKLIVPRIPMANGSRHHARHLGHAQVQRTTAPAVQKTVHSHKRLARCRSFRKFPILRQAAMQAKRHKNRLAVSIHMRQTAPKGDHEKRSARADETFSAVRWPIGNRPPVGNWPHHGL